jgi:hypothetical protein
MIDLAKIGNVREFRLANTDHVKCPDCDGKGCDECKMVGWVHLKRCSDCKELKLPECFYGQTKKQSRCISCYKAAYGAYYRRSLREARR